MTIRYASNDLRNAFTETVEERLPVDQAVISQLTECMDIMPRTICDELDLPAGSNYADGAKALQQG